jgi:hypothetical protein
VDGYDFSSFTETNYRTSTHVTQFNLGWLS